LSIIAPLDFRKRSLDEFFAAEIYDLSIIPNVWGYDLSES
jgi:hypothetical protein